MRTSLASVGHCISSPEGLLLLPEPILPPITRPEVPENEGCSHTNNTREVVPPLPGGRVTLRHVLRGLPEFLQQDGALVSLGGDRLADSPFPSCLPEALLRSWEALG